MSIKSQENNMRRLHGLLSQDLGYIWGERECGPNGAKKAFLNTGKVFLRALAKDMGLRDARVTSNAAGIAVSGECDLRGMWGEENGIHICIEQFTGASRYVMLYRSIRAMDDHKGGYNHLIRLDELGTLTYEGLMSRFMALRKEQGYGLAA